jgi:glycerol uptake facilitator-like aquaporin
MNSAKRPAAQDAPAAPAAGGQEWTARHIRNGSACELLLTFVLLFGVVTIVRWVIGPSAVSRAIPQIHLELLIVGAGVGLLITGLILSPAGRVSGGHLNPAITLATWFLGAFPARGLVPYITAQLAGSVLGALAGGALWGRAADRPPVSYAALQPAAGWTGGQVFAVEGAGMAVIVLIVAIFLSTPRLAPEVPWVVGLLIGAAIALLGTATGGSVNPARQFGPAIASGHYAYLYAYLIAPMAGAALAVAALRIGRPSFRIISHHLHGTGAALRP